MDQERTKPEDSPAARGKTGLSIPVIISAVPGIALLLSVVHEWAYFSVIGADLIRFMRIGDYFSVALKWLPETVIFMFLGLALQYVMTRIEGGMSEEELIARSPVPRFTRWFRASANYAMRLTVLVGVPLAVLTLPIWLSFFIAIPVLVAWVYTAEWLTGHERVLGWLSPTSKMAFEWLPALVLLIGMYGAWDAVSVLISQQGDREVHLRSGTTLNVLLLRPLEVGLLVRQPDMEKVLMIPWQDIEEFRKPSKTPPMTSTVCYVFGKFC
jgi:hypothetical protein